MLVVISFLEEGGPFLALMFFKGFVMFPVLQQETNYSLVFSNVVQLFGTLLMCYVMAYYNVINQVHD